KFVLEFLRTFGGQIGSFRHVTSLYLDVYSSLARQCQYILTVQLFGSAVEQNATLATAFDVDFIQCRVWIVAGKRRIHCCTQRFKILKVAQNFLFDFALENHITVSLHNVFKVSAEQPTK